MKIKDNNIEVMGRLIPPSNKIHQNQEVYSSDRGICTIKATCYKDAPKILVKEVYYEQDRSVREFD